jgi:hypothetical protein
MLFRRVGKVLVAFHDESPPTREEWGGWVEACRVGSPQGVVTLIGTLGGSPNSVQRAELSAAVGKDALPSAVLTSSKFIRSVVTAFSWLGVRSRAYDLHEWPQVQAFLNLSDAELALAKRTFDEFTITVHGQQKTVSRT